MARITVAKLDRELTRIHKAGLQLTALRGGQRANLDWLAAYIVDKMHVGTPMREVGMKGLNRGLRTLGRRKATGLYRNERQVLGEFVRAFKRRHRENRGLYAFATGAIR